MSPPTRLYVFLNLGGGHEKFNAKLRQVFGDVHLVLVFPKGYKPSEIERQGADEVYVLGGSGMLPALIRAVVDIRRQRIDCFLVQFDSLKLRLFAAAMKPKQCLWWRGDGYVVALPVSIPGTLWHLFSQRTRGLLSLGRIYASIYFGKFKVVAPKE